MTNGVAARRARSSRGRAQHSTLPALAVTTGLALAYAGALIALLLGAR
jgi:hypothetical protein